MPVFYNSQDYLRYINQLRNNGEYYDYCNTDGVRLAYPSEEECLDLTTSQEESVASAVQGPRGLRGCPGPPGPRGPRAAIC